MTPGDVLGSLYELESRLGKGGMGEVWRARNLETHEHVAVKVLLAELAQDAAVQKRFLREARAAAAVRHPNVVELRDVRQSDDGAPFLVMELLTGETLGRRLRRKRILSIAEIASIFLPVFDAVEAAHAAGLVHRDLKPENIFLAHEDSPAKVRVRVLDFGIAKRVEKLATPSASSADVTAPAETTAAMLGTPYYMAPEQALGERDIDGRADVWSLGVVLYECLTGRRPTEATTLGGILKIIVTDGVVPIETVLPELDGGVAEALGNMLRSAREARAPSLEAMRACLVALAEPGYRLETETDEGIPASVQRPPPARDIQAPALAAPANVRSRRVVVIIGAVLGILALILGVRALDRVPASAPPPPATALAVGTADPGPSVLLAPSSSLAPPSTSPSLAPSLSPASRARLYPSIMPAVATPTPTPTPTPSAVPAPSRGPSGLVTDNPFASPPTSAPR